MKKMPVWLILCVVCLGAALCSGRICWHGSRFCLHNISSPLGIREEWEVAPVVADCAIVEEALSQPYVYLGNGAQCFAFVSEDGKYVLKFFKMKHLIPKSWLKAVPFLDGYRKKKVEMRERRLRETFGAFKMAYEEFKEESGLLCVHLNPTKTIKKKVVLSRGDALWSVDLDRVPFLLQERAELIYDRFRRLIAAGDVEGLRKALASAFVFFEQREAKGFIDQDGGVSGNFGFVGDRVVQVDVGRLQRKEGASEEELSAGKRAALKLHQWVEGCPALNELTSDVDFH